MASFVLDLVSEVREWPCDDSCLLGHLFGLFRLLELCYAQCGTIHESLRALQRSMRHWSSLHDVIFGVRDRSITECAMGGGQRRHEHRLNSLSSQYDLFGLLNSASHPQVEQTQETQAKQSPQK
eukprot:CAMPEP_0185613112 /NCGR_PEP_ID=MMETSP0436-20130131/25154_1 /TAXON_ID=626734 ORGANISM="Favella taraikaensis, Strain Fe Narragansett Bay" /NCGR_SAMPLE_ID=MMETSP0436 /ASSEMBLY_ACC=CAM_ASM_000390 /LENGTH=123 /DNA_ID=CAMNT_0028246925 /DNA_START=307 /DNA_END=678 /DNA_ORIENTATION=-